MEITDAILFVEVLNLSFEFQICLSNCNFVSTDLPLPKPVPCYWRCDAIFPVIQVKPLRVNPDIFILCINIPHLNPMGNLSPYFKVPRKFSYYHPRCYHTVSATISSVWIVSTPTLSIMYILIDNQIAYNENNRPLSCPPTLNTIPQMRLQLGFSAISSFIHFWVWGG